MKKFKNLNTEYECYGLIKDNAVLYRALISLAPLEIILKTLTSAPGFFAKAEMGSIRFQRRKIFLAVIAFGGPRSSCSGQWRTTPLRYAVRHWPAQMT